GRTTEGFTGGISISSYSPISSSSASDDKDPPHRSQWVGMWSRNSSGLSASRRLCGSCPRRTFTSNPVPMPGTPPVGLRPPFVTPAAAHSHPDCRWILILIVAPQRRQLREPLAGLRDFTVTLDELRRPDV